MPEKLNGKEALKQLPLVDVILPKEEAMLMLTANTRKAVLDNIDFIRDKLRSRGVVSPSPQESQESIKKKIAKEYAPGGLSLVEDDYNALLSEFGTMSYLQLVSMFFKDVRLF